MSEYKPEDDQTAMSFPTTLAEHMRFPDARREIFDLICCLSPILSPLKKEFGGEFTLSEYDDEAAKELRRAIERVRRFSEWMEEKLNLYIAHTDPKVKLRTPTRPPIVHWIGQRKFLIKVVVVGNALHVKCNNLWDTCILRQEDRQNSDLQVVLEGLFRHEESLETKR